MGFNSGFKGLIRRSVGRPTYRQWSICRFPSRPNVMDPTSDQRLLQGSSFKLLYYIEMDLSRLQTSIPSESGSFNQWPLHTAAAHNTANKTPLFVDFIVQKMCVAYTGSVFNGYVRYLFHTTSALNTLRTGSFKLFKRPFPGFLTILTL